MNHDMMVPDMAISQSLTSIMEEMVTEVMEDAVSTSIIFTQALVKEEHKVILLTKSRSLKSTHTAHMCGGPKKVGGTKKLVDLI